MSEFYLKGQKALQKITGEEEIAKGRAPMLQATLHQRAVTFIENQIFVFLGSEDTEGNIWISLLVGKRGFVKVPSLEEVRLDLSQVVSNKEDIYFTNIITKPTTGILFHEAARRLRYRAWGKASLIDGQLSLKIRMGYKSCPKHIQKVAIELPETIEPLHPTYTKGSSLGASELAWISNAHTFFVSTQTERGDVETSTRGGDPGFIEILENGQLRIPDYWGNSIYSTLGNMYINPKAALLFLDFETGECLQMTGTTALQFDQNSNEDFYKSGETGRFWTFDTKQWIRTANHHKVNAQFIEFSRFNVPHRK